MTRTAPLPASLRIGLSFLALALGWTVAYLGLILAQVHGPGFGYVTDFELLLAWSALFVAAGWALVVVPLVLRVAPDHWLFDPRWAPVVGAVAGMAVLALLLLPFRLLDGVRQPPLLTFAAGVGLIGWTTYTLVVRSGLAARLAARPGLRAWLYVLPLAAALAFALAGWPLLERVAPGAAFRYGSPAARARIAGRILAGIRAGERIEDIDRRLPGLFPPGPPGEAVRITGNLGLACYGLDVRDGVIAWIGFEDPCRGLAARPRSTSP